MRGLCCCCWCRSSKELTPCLCVLQVSCLALSKSGRYLASGQVTYMGFTADIIIWDLETRQLMHRMALHKVKIQALDFSCDERYLASLGGPDDNSLVRAWSPPVPSITALITRAGPSDASSPPPLTPAFRFCGTCTPELQCAVAPPTPTSRCASSSSKTAVTS